MSDEPYTDYDKWEQAMDKEMDKICDNDAFTPGTLPHCNQDGTRRTCTNCQMSLWWEDFDMIMRIQLYAAFHNAMEEISGE